MYHVYSNNCLFDLKSSSCPPVESNTLEHSTTLSCHGTWLSFLIQLVVAALSPNPPPERGVCSVLSRHEEVTEKYLVFGQLLKSYAPTSLVACSPVESNTLERSTTLSCHETWLSFLVQLEVAALSPNPLPELGVYSVMLWHETVAELHLKFTQLFKSYASTSLGWLPVESNTLELSNTLSCHNTWFSFLAQLEVLALSRNPLPELGSAEYRAGTRQLPNCTLYSHNC